jgi:cysteine desulfurase
MVYLDYTANTPASEEVLARFCAVERQYIGNANALHTAGRQAAQEMERVTCRIAELLGVRPEEIIYTSGASESNNLAVKGLAAAGRHVGRHIVSTALEHSSVSACLSALQEQGYEIDLVDFDRSGKLDLEQLESLLRKDTVLVSVSAVDSELGTVQPVAEIAQIVRRFPGCRLHLDATQAMGKTPVDFSLADTISFAPHKFYGLNGCGVLVKHRNVPLEPLIHGGASTTIYRAGTPALALAASIEPALASALAEETARAAHVARLNARLREALSQYPKVRINSPADAVPHILNLSVAGVRGARFQKALDEQGVCVSVKSACASDGLPSRAVFAVSHDRKNALSSWRISLSHQTTDAEIEEFLRAFDVCYRALTEETAR